MQYCETEGHRLRSVCASEVEAGCVELYCEVSAATDEGLGNGLEAVLKRISSYAALKELVMEVEVRRVSGARGCDPALLDEVREIAERGGLSPQEKALPDSAPAADIWVCREVGQVLEERGWELWDAG